MSINQATFDTVIGGGGFGTIYGSTRYPNLVLKNITDVSLCACAQYEFLIHKKIYDAYENVEICHPVDYVYIPKPITFDSGSYGCNYLMERLQYIDEYYVHIAINDTLPETSKNKLIGRDYSKPVGIDNPPRGFFAGMDAIEDIIESYENIDSLSDIIYRMGYLFGSIVFGAQMYPIDVEYGLVLKDDNLTVTVIDFGMCLPHSFELDEIPLPDEYRKCAKSLQYTVEDVLDTIFLDVYYTPEEEYVTYYLEGLTDAYNCFKPILNDKARQLYDKIIDYIQSMAS